MAKTISAGVVVTDGTRILLCHVTGAQHWDLPKGKLDPNEEPIDAAVRELREETSLIADANDLRDLGLFPYKKNKDLRLWLWLVDQLPDPVALDCASMFDDGKGTMRKEMDGFSNVHWEKIKSYVVPDMLRVLTEVRSRI